MARRVAKTGKTSKATRPGDKLGPVLEFMSLLWAVNHGLESLSKRMEAALGVTGAQRLVLRIVGQNPGIGAGPLAEILRVHPSTLTGVMQRLVERRLLKRARDPDDARRAVLELTAAGRVIDALRAGTVEAAVKRMLRGLQAGRGARDRARPRRDRRRAGPGDPDETATTPILIAADRAANLSRARATRTASRSDLRARPFRPRWPARRPRRSG